MRCRDVPMPIYIARLPRDERGFPIPFFAPTIEGKKSFAVSDSSKRLKCAKHRLYWIRGKRLRLLIAFVGGPCCVEIHAYSDGPMHVDCAIYAVKVCPWMALPEYKKRMFEHLGDSDSVIEPKKPDMNAVCITNGFKVTTGKNWVFIPFTILDIQWWKDGVRQEKFTSKDP